MSLASGPECFHRLRPGHSRRLRRLALAVVLAVVALAAVSGLSDSALEGVQVEENLVYRAECPKTCRLDLYRADGPPPPGGWPVVVAIHGGGWSGGSFHGYGRSVARLARHGVAVASVGYHLCRSPEDPPGWPRNRDDIRASVVWIRQHAREYDLDPDRIAVLGASAGGHLAALLGTDPGPEIDGCSARVRGVIDFYGPADLPALRDVPNAHAAVESLLGGSLQDRQALALDASPLRHVSRDDPPMLLIHGVLDPTVPLAQSEKLAQSLQAHGVPHRLIEVEGAAHGFGLKTPARDFVPEILEFLAACWDDTVRYRSSETRSASPGTSTRVADRCSSGP